ncbi:MULTISPECIES: hypothetical protein [Acetobacteraceae]|uniref:Uncharacterized protein n=1 Tax=Komagataeibacter rhaeticus TaxID=215221 RepID=A0A858JLA6_9PROT|nr:MULTISPECIES: hypothetical protein [Acetobacteraceae]MCE2576904.1 hypothetical protein [Komagataeibacter sp. FNDCR2]QIP34487.1 hypothetical protein GWK63_02390 [Komagataeibacter rhaeticus]QOC47004.1 hypothetical protein ICJ78_02385 [Komagataeibacter rhaeticus]
MKIRVKIDISYIGEQVAHQCFLENRNIDDLDLYLAGAAYAICFSLFTEKPWMKEKFAEIGSEIAKSGTRKFSELMEMEILKKSYPEGNA